MIRKRRINFIVALLTVCLMLSNLTVSLAAPAVRSEQTDELKTTDFLAYLDETPIRVYELNGKTMILLEDLKDYGFSVSYDDSIRTLFVTKTSQKADDFQPVYEREEPGKACGQVVETDIQTLVNGRKIQSYAVDGKMVVAVDDLTACVGAGEEAGSIFKMSSIYDNDSKKLWLSTKDYSQYGEKGYTSMLSEYSQLDSNSDLRDCYLLTDDYIVYTWKEYPPRQLSGTMKCLLHANISYRDGTAECDLISVLKRYGAAGGEGYVWLDVGGSYPSLQIDPETEEILYFDSKDKVYRLNPYTMLMKEVSDSSVVDGIGYTDIHEHWAEAAINRMSATGVINGYPDGTFKPDASVSRAEVAKIISLAFELDTPIQVDYPDVQPDDWFAPYIGLADPYMPEYAPYESGRPYTDPYIRNYDFYTLSGERFLPQQADLRMFLAETLSVLKAKREGVEITFPEISEIEDELSQAFIDGHFSERLTDPHGNKPLNYVRMLQYCWISWKMGIFEGDDNHWFGPMEPVTRAALVVTIDRILNPSENQQKNL